MGCHASSQSTQSIDKYVADGWTVEKSAELQAAVDRIFGSGGDNLLGLSFSFTIADPQLPDCPLIGCSRGFSTLTGYEVSEIVGRNCRFLVDPVPEDHIDQSMRRRCREFCIAAAGATAFQKAPREILAVQKNARKDGTLFNNMFYMRVIGLGGVHRRYITGLQSEIPAGNELHDLGYPQLCLKLKHLDENMNKVESILANEFTLTSMGTLFPAGWSEDNPARMNRLVGSMEYAQWQELWRRFPNQTVIAAASNKCPQVAS